MKEQRAYRSRFYPTPDQAAVLARTLGCARAVANWALRLRTDVSYERQERLGSHDASAALTALKQQPATGWLNEVASVPLQQAWRHLDRAFRTCFEGRARYPTFRTKRGRQAATSASRALRWERQTRPLRRAKMETPRDIHWSRSFQGVPSTVPLSRDTPGRCCVALLVDEEIHPLPVAPALVGGERGLKDLAVLSSGEKMANSTQLRRRERNLAHAPRPRARNQLGAKKRDTARLKVARVHATSADQRCEGLPKLTTRLLREHQTICSESLAVKTMGRKHALAKAISDAGWGELVRQVEYKAAW